MAFDVPPPVYLPHQDPPLSFLPTAVVVDRDYARIAALPRVDWDAAADLLQLTAALTSYLRTPNGTQTLRPVQAAALRAAFDNRGLLGAIRVGAGKTLVTLLAGTLLGARNPVLVVPASLREKTYSDARLLAKDWRIGHLTVFSYEELGRAGGSIKLVQAAPDLLMLDEAHRVKNRKAAVTKKLGRAVAHFKPIVLALSGSIAGRSFSEYWLAAKWSLREGCPLPLDLRSFLAWSYALDEKVPEFSRLDPGPLVELTPGALGDSPLARARDAYSKRFVSCPGVISTKEDIPANGLQIEVRKIDAPQHVRTAIAQLRADWATPDGHQFETAIELWIRERWLARGGYYVWDPYPPPEWRGARKQWHDFVRDALRNSRTLDSPDMIKRAVVNGRLNDLGALAQWQAIEPTFTPNSVWRWLPAGSHAMITDAVAWLRRNPERGIVWAQHQAIGAAVSQLAEVPYYCAEASDSNGRHIKDARSSCVASISSCSAGQNLQWFSGNYLLEFPTKGDRFEQLIGRTHRDGQEADDVSIVVPVMTVGDSRALEQAVRDARYIESTTRIPQKLLYGTWYGFDLSKETELL